MIGELAGVVGFGDTSSEHLQPLRVGSILRACCRSRLPTQGLGGVNIERLLKLGGNLEGLKRITVAMAWDW